MARSAMSLAAPPPSVTPARWMLTDTVPSAPATTLSMSPAWCVAEPARPCALPVGLKCPPALLASAALQSPFSCTWMPCTLLGWSPPMVPVRCTPSPIGCSVTRPLTRLPDAEARFACAEVAVLCACGASGCFGGGVAQPARVAAMAAETRAMAVPVRMGGSLGSVALAAGAELAGDSVTSESKAGRGLAAVSLGLFEGGVEQHAVEACQRGRMQVRRTLREAFVRPAEQR